MKKYLQNQIATSSFSLFVASIVTIIVWLAAGLLTHRWWVQLAILGASAYLMVEMSNNNALLRVRSRLVTTVFLLFSSCFPAYFSSLPGAVVTLCFIVSLLLMFQTYQRPDAAGLMFYAYLSIGIASLFWVQSFLFVPLFWLLSLTQLQSFSLRTWMASLLGLFVPYWFAIPWILYHERFGQVIDHFALLSDFSHTFDYTLFSLGDKLTIILTLILFVHAFLHFKSRSFEDRIRIRQLYEFFAWTTLAVAILMLTYPQFYDPLMRIALICVSPFVAHFFTLTHSRITNLTFIASCILTVAVIAFNLYESVSSVRVVPPVTSWSGLLTF